jgi:hypothetical protein
MRQTTRAQTYIRAYGYGGFMQFASNSLVKVRTTVSNLFGVIAMIALLSTASLPALSQVPPTSSRTGYEVREINVPNSTGTFAQGVNVYNDVVGYAQGVDSQQTVGFVYKQGEYGLLLFPHADGSTRGFGINDLREVVGDFLGTDGYRHGFMEADGKYTQYDLALGSASTSIFGVNNGGAFVGTVGSEGFVNIGGKVTEFYASGTDLTYANAINNSNQVVGQYQDSSGNWHGFSFDVTTSVVTPINYPGATQTIVVGINDASVVSGYYQIGKGPNQGSYVSFVEANGVFETVDFFSETNGINNAGSFVGTYSTFVFNTPMLQTYGYLATPFPLRSVRKVSVPGAASTNLYGINNASHIVGSYTDTSGTTHGLYIDGSKQITIDFPGSVPGSTTYLGGINDSDVIVGAYWGPQGNNFGGQPFSYFKGVFTNLSLPLESAGVATGISNSGWIVGYGTSPEVELSFGFVYDGSTYQLIGTNDDVFFANGINDSGEVTESSPDQWLQGFEYLLNVNTGESTNLFVPGAYGAEVFGINDLGDMAFGWSGGEGGHAAILKNCVNTDSYSFDVFDVDGPAGDAVAYGINDKKVVVGTYQKPSTDGSPATSEGFIVQFFLR